MGGNGEAQADTGRRDLIKKAAIGGGIIWAAPAILSSPVAAASPPNPPCSGGGVLDWSAAFGPTNQWAPGGSQSASLGDGYSVTVASAFHGYTASRSVFPGDQTTGTAGYLRLSQLVNNTANTSWSAGGRAITITFNQPVTNVRFHITDIDAAPSSGFDDRVSVSPGVASFPALPSPGSSVTGSAAELYNSNANLNTGETTVQGRADIIAAGPLTVLSINYWNGPRHASASGYQAIWISDITFDCAG